MKKKFSRNISVAKFISENSKYKILFLVVILIGVLYSLSTPAGNTTGNLVVDFFGDSLGIISCIMIFLFSTLITLNTFDEQKSIIIRCKTKKEYFKKLISIVSLVNFITCLILFCILIAFLLFIKSPVLGIHDIYNIPMIFYMLFLFFKVYLVYNLIFVVFVVLDKKYNTLVGTIVPLTTLIVMLLSNITIGENGVFHEFKLNIAYYFSNFSFESFKMEVLYFLLFFIIYSFLAMIIISLVLNKNLFKNNGMKYITMKNINLFKSKLFKFYLIQLAFFLLVMILYFNDYDASIFQTIKEIIGVSKLNNGNAIISLYNLLTFFVTILVSSKMFFEDISMLKNISNRIEEKKYISINLINNIFIIFFMKIIPIIIITLVLIFKSYDVDSFKLLIIYCYYLINYLIVGMSTNLFLNLYSKQSKMKMLSIIPVAIIIGLVLIDVSKINLIVLLILLSVLVFTNVKTFDYKENYEKYA